MKRILLFLLSFTFIFISSGLVFAQDSNSNCVITNIGTGNPNAIPPNCSQNSSSGTSNMASTAMALFDAGSPCGDINKSTYNCMIRNIKYSSMPYPEAAASNISNGVNNVVDPYQCINFVESTVAGTYGNIWDSWNNANWYIGQSPSVINNPSISWRWIYASSGTPVSGDVPVFTHNHIAVIIQVVDASRGVVKIVEANYDENGDVNERQILLPPENPISGINNDVAGWLHNNG